MHKLILFAVLSFLMTLATPALSEVVYCTNCSDRFMQALDRTTNMEQLARLWAQYEEDVVQTTQQIRMVQQNIEQYQNMVKNTDSISPNLMRHISGDFRRLADQLNRLKTQKGDTEALEQVYTHTFPEYARIEGIVARSPEEYQAGWEEWSRTVDQAALATFQVSGSQLDALVQSDEFDDHIQELLNSPEGRMQALQAGNQLTALQIREARELRTLIAAHVQSQVQASQKAEKEGQSDRATFLKMLEADTLDPVAKEEPKQGADNSI